jgi:hypothetical protein
VCGHASYSASGIHPQCSHLRSEPTRLKRASALPKGAATEASVKSSNVWYRPCPSCGKSAHVRTKVCSCGRVLGVAAEQA